MFKRLKRYWQRSEYHDVYNFHKYFQLLHHMQPGHLTQRKLNERVAFMQEELNEFIEAAKTQDLTKQADALVDLVYVTLGTAVMLGLPWHALWKIVHQANLKKERRVSLTGDHHDVVKPIHWIPPEGALTHALRAAGYVRRHWCNINHWDGMGVPPISDALSRDDPHHKTLDSAAHHRS